jgi:hypothetical protein
MQDGSLESENGEYRFTMQGDGNLVLYRGGDPLWASGTDGEYGAHCVFQKDGHFLVYRCGEDGRVSTDPDDCVWKTDIFGDEGTFHGGWCCMQNDGNFVQYDRSGRPLWCTRTDGGQQGDRSGGIDRLI